MSYKSKFGRRHNAKKALIMNLSKSLINYGTITTTTAKAKVLKRQFDKLITIGKKGRTNAAYNSLRTKLGNDVKCIERLFNIVVPSFESYNDGGYTLSAKHGFRRGDSAPMTVVQARGIYETLKTNIQNNHNKMENDDVFQNNPEDTIENSNISA